MPNHWIAKAKTPKELILKQVRRLTGALLSKKTIWTISILLTCAYLTSMLIYPWLAGSGSWAYVQSAWSNWQTLNGSIIALAAVFMGFKISRDQEERQRDRDFKASKAFLPAALSELCSYFKKSSYMLNAGWASISKYEEENGKWIVLSPFKLAELPALPQNYASVFQDCIKNAPPEVGSYLADILVWLQIHDSRSTDVYPRKSKDEFPEIKANIFLLFYDLGRLQAKTLKLLPFARSMSDFDSSPLTWDNFDDAYNELGIQATDIIHPSTGTLKQYTIDKQTREVPIFFDIKPRSKT